MTEQQFAVLASLMGLSEPDRAAAHAVIFENERGTVAAANIVDRLREADMAIRGAYVVHGPMEFRIVVGHRDTHRAPGALELNIGDVVQLTAQSTERWIPVRVTALPTKPTDYYSGVIIEQLVTASRYQVGNGVRFSEDQVMSEAPRAASSFRRRRYY
ncbi:alpha/beta hydrolase [Parapusillimonas sp. JC17]|uniref:alpha/beta hydrolase n=1 Tax=Parapusillimonas sp. JC17 TaxID=3445768 RepID=UPI003FA059FF